MHSFIVVEGLSASGKSTLGERLAEKIEGIVYKTPGELFVPVRAVIDKKADLTARFLFYLAGLVQSSVEISKLCESQPVVCDRYVDTTVCYHKAMGVPTDIFAANIHQVLKKPDFTFLVVCQQDERLRRLHARGMSHNDEVERGAGIEERFLKEYCNRKLIEIDNSGNDPDIGVGQMMKYLKART